MILYFSILIFINQLVFIGCRTWNVKAISRGNLKAAIISGAVVHVSWLVSIAIGSVSMVQIIENFSLEYIPVVCCSLVGGLIGTYIGMKEKGKI